MSPQFPILDVEALGAGNNLAAASDDIGAGHSFPLVAYESVAAGGAL